MKTLAVFVLLLLLASCGVSETHEAPVPAQDTLSFTGEVANIPSTAAVSDHEANVSQLVSPALAIASLRDAYPVPDWKGGADSFVKAGPPSEVLAIIDNCVDELRFSGAVEVACFGLIQKACPGMNGTTTDMVNCGGAEFDYWDRRLNTAYKKLMSALKSDDELMGDQGALPGLRLSETVRKAQRSWIRYRDDSCAVERDRFRGGTLGRITGINCMALETARRSVELERLLMSFEM
jgi:uncharacterized protein YecT (DUF1311 family)